MDRPIERIEQLLLTQGVKPREVRKTLAGICGISVQAVGQWFTTDTEITAKNLQKIAAYLRTTVEHLLTGKAPAAAVREPAPGYQLVGVESWDDSTPLDPDEVAVPFYKEVEFAAGSGKAPAVEVNGRKLRYSRATLRNAGVDPANAACATNTGNSMEPMIQDGATIGIDCGRTQIADGEIYAIDHDGMLRVKYLYRLPGGGIRLRSLNSEEHPDEIYGPDDAKRIKVLGWVWTWSTLRKWRGKS